MLQPLVVECDNRSEVAASGGALSGTRAELFVARQDGARRIGVGFHRAEHVTRLRVAIANVLLAGGFTTAIGTLRLLHQQTCQDYTRRETYLQRRHRFSPTATSCACHCYASALGKQIGLQSVPCVPGA